MKTSLISLAMIFWLAACGTTETPDEADAPAEPDSSSEEATGPSSAPSPSDTSSAQRAPDGLTGFGAKVEAWESVHGDSISGFYEGSGFPLPACVDPNGSAPCHRGAGRLLQRDEEGVDLEFLHPQNPCLETAGFAFQRCPAESREHFFALVASVDAQWHVGQRAIQRDGPAGGAVEGEVDDGRELVPDRRFPLKRRQAVVI